MLIEVIDPFEYAKNLDRSIDIEKAILGLPEIELEVVYRMFVVGQSGADIGDLLGVSGEYVRQIKQRALKRLRARLYSYRIR